MTIKMECVLESLKKDYHAIGKLVGLLILIVAAVAIAEGITYVVVIEMVNVAASIAWPRITAVTAFVILEAVVMILSLVCVIGLKSEDAKSKIALVCNVGRGAISLVVVLLFFLFGSFMETLEGRLPYPDVTVIFLGFQVMNVILTPVALAYARCKDEPPVERRYIIWKILRKI